MERRQPRILLFGSKGQVGFELARTLARLGDVEEVDRARLDLTDFNAVRRAVRDAAPEVIVNAAAYTQVEKAESERVLAFRINGEAPEVLAAEAARSKALLVHFSTDYVFDGSETRPYREDDVTDPGTAYGASKLAGDIAILGSDASAYIFRVAWVYSRRGHNFLNTISRLARERDQLRVVADQHGSPTCATAIADATTLAIDQWLTSRRADKPSPPRGVYHMSSPDHTTWHAFAEAIVARMDLPEGQPRPRVIPISSSEYPSQVARPLWTVLDSRKLLEKFGLALAPWKSQLAQCGA